MTTKKDTKCSMAFSQEEIDYQEPNEDMRNLFKDYVRSYRVDIGVMKEHFTEWVKDQNRSTDCFSCSGCPDCSKSYLTTKCIKCSSCSKCMKHLRDQMKERKDYR